MVQPRSVEAPTPTQRQRFRDSLRDAVDGVDVEELQGTRRPAGPPPGQASGASRTVLVHPAEAPARTLPANPAAPWTPGRAMAPLEPDSHEAQLQAQIEVALQPLRREVAALRVEVVRLRSLPAELSGLRRADMLTIAGVLTVVFVAAALVVGVILRV